MFDRELMTIIGLGVGKMLVVSTKNTLQNMQVRKLNLRYVMIRGVEKALFVISRSQCPFLISLLLVSHERKYNLIYQMDKRSKT